ncbi:MAG: prepilin-type N-terminal cleavage/methylation domain-containing protein [Phycisphaerales bacterium]|nr:MAG: prepilin-type N-terminal cleavage/methylation domain-containing protein [Phycisphaerales bacterium]
MRHQVKRHDRTVGNAGFTMVECLIGLAISAMLLTALTVAFNASIINFRENEKMFESVNNARQALTRMTSELRTADSVSFFEPSNRCVFFGAAEPSTLITYEYRDATDPNDPETLVLIKNGTAYTLCDDVTAASFTKTQADGDPNGLDSKSVLISMTVKTGDQERTLAAAAVVRRALVD